MTKPTSSRLKSVRWSFILVADVIKAKVAIARDRRAGCIWEANPTPDRISVGGNGTSGFYDRAHGSKHRAHAA